VPGFGPRTAAAVHAALADLPGAGVAVNTATGAMIDLEPGGEGDRT
jgi:hypothetical protein